MDFCRKTKKEIDNFRPLQKRKFTRLYHCYSDKGLKDTGVKSECNFVNGARQDLFKFHQQFL